MGGYGALHVRVGGKRRLIKAHRAVFELTTGECPPTVDHTCHDSNCPQPGPSCPHRRCGNPAHLKAATHAANASRAKTGAHQDTCRAGHPMTAENVYTTPSAGERRCRACAADRARENRESVTLTRGQVPRQRSYRPRGMPLPELVAWALDGQDTSACCYWPGHTEAGYTEVTVGTKRMAAHRLIFEVLRGPIPTGMVIDHTCHIPGECRGGPLCPHRPCINPDHLEVVPPAVNTGIARAARRRPDQCKRGHAFTARNTYTDPTGRRHCRACAAERARNATKQSPKPPRERCRNGHELTPDNLVATAPESTQRHCLQCRRDRSARYEARKRGAATTN